MEPVEQDPEPKPDAERCPQCGGWIIGFSANQAECQGCGYMPPGMSPASASIADDAAPSVVCPKCGAVVEKDGDSRFCDQCGAALADAKPAQSMPPEEPERPADGVCPACRGPIREVTPDRGVCQKCGLRVMTPEARMRQRAGFFLVLLIAVGYIIFMMYQQPHRGY